MICPKCGDSKSKCVDSRVVEGTTRRRRECLQCEARWTTYEVTFHEATGFYDHNPPIEQPFALMQDLVALSLDHRIVVYRIIEAFLAKQAAVEIQGKDAA